VRAERAVVAIDKNNAVVKFYVRVAVITFGAVTRFLRLFEVEPV